MKLGKRIAAFCAVLTLAVFLAVPASARGCGHRTAGGEGCHRSVIAAAVLGQQAQDVLAQVKTSGVCTRVLMAESGKLEEFQQELLRLRDECAANGSCPNVGVCDGTGQGYGYGNGLGQGNGAGYGCGYGNGQGRGGHHGGGHHGGHCW